MMSILISGMEKPKKCCAMVGGECVMCPFVNDDDECVVLLQMGKRIPGTWQDQYAQCPLVELSESHGRLIDVDKLLRDAPRYVDYPPHYEPKLLSILDVENAPTVIEAEGGENHNET